MSHLRAWRTKATAWCLCLSQTPGLPGVAPLGTVVQLQLMVSSTAHRKDSLPLIASDVLQQVLHEN